MVELVAARGEDPGGGGENAVALVLLEDLASGSRCLPTGAGIRWSGSDATRARITRARSFRYQKTEVAVSN